MNEEEPQQPQEAGEDMVDQEADAAGAEAGSIGGRAEHDVDEGERPVREAGGGESEGFEEAERELTEAAEHSEESVSPLEQAGEPEEPHDQAHGEADREESDGP